MYRIISKYINSTLAIVVITLLAAPAYAATNAGGDKSFGYSNLYGKVTPTQVYSLLHDMDTLLLSYAGSHKKNLASQIQALKLKSVKGKTPGQAFKKLAQLSDVLDRLSKSVQLLPMERVKQEKKKVIPAEVYLQAANCMDALAYIMIKLEPNKQWGDYYNLRKYDRGKSPSDVFALADLAVRRLDIALR